MTSFIRQPGRCKTQTIISIIFGTYCILSDGGASDLNLETLIRRCMDDSRRQPFNPNTDLYNTVWLAQLPKILLVSPTNNVVDVLEERLKEELSVFDETTNR